MSLFKLKPFAFICVKFECYITNSSECQDTVLTSIAFILFPLNAFCHRFFYVDTFIRYLIHFFDDVLVVPFYQTM